MNTTQTNEVCGVPLEVIEQAAQVTYAAVRELGISAGEMDNPTWQIAMESVKGDYRHLVRRVFWLRNEGDANRHAEDLHTVWVLKKDAEGWTLGPYDPARRTHPMLKPWSELSALQRFQYELFLGTARSFAGLKTRVK